jgi:hypothetical protein
MISFMTYGLEDLLVLISAWRVSNTVAAKMAAAAAAWLFLSTGFRPPEPKIMASWGPSAQR